MNGGLSGLETGNVVVRPMEVTDVSILERWYADPARPRSRHDERCELQEKGEGEQLVAWVNGRPLGWVFLDWAAPETARCARLVDLWVSDAARGNGAGSALLDHALEHARARGCVGVELAVTISNSFNDRARDLYVRRGFEPYGEAYEDGYWYWTTDGERHWDGEPHQRMRLLF